MKNPISSSVKINLAWSISTNLVILHMTEIGHAIPSHQVVLKT